MKRLSTPSRRCNGVDERIAGIVLDSIDEGVFTVDRDCLITSFNKAAEKITGFSAGQAIGRHCFDIFRTEVCHKRCALRDSLLVGVPIENARVTIITRQGVEVPISVSTACLRDERGEVIGAVEFFRSRPAAGHRGDWKEEGGALAGIVSSSPRMRRVIDTLPDIAESECNVLIQGPSGSGKELFAEAIHSLSPRRYGPFIRINCAALPATLLESELFGYARGAFTDAKRDKPGHFWLASGGTLLLDEVGEMDVSLQVKLLRVLNNGEFQPLGSTKSLRTDARIIAATNLDLKAAISAGRFREDLYFRLNVVTIDLPPLRERPEDLPPLVEHFVRKVGRRTRKPIKRVSPEALVVLGRYDFPGNIRELENAIEHAFVMCRDDEIRACHLPPRIFEGGGAPAGAAQNERCDRQAVQDALNRAGGNRERAAAELGIHRATLWRKMKTYGIVS